MVGRWGFIQAPSEVNLRWHISILMTTTTVMASSPLTLQATGRSSTRYTMKVKDTQVYYEGEGYRGIPRYTMKVRDTQYTMKVKDTQVHYESKGYPGML